MRTAGIPQMMYGCEIMGVADTTLDSAVRIAAAAMAPPTAGKNPKLVMHAMSVHSDTVDPRYNGNTTPISTWALAWWDGWTKGQQLLDAFRMISADSGTSMACHWNTVTGPVRALIATCQRLKWSSADGRKFTDDTGVVWDVALDPPAAIAAAARRSTKRLATDAILRELPTAKPQHDDIRHHSAHAAELGRSGCRTSVHVNLVPALRPLYKGGKRCLKKNPMWEQECAAYLTSAITGGQWTEIRKAKLPGYNGPALCQLCLGSSYPLGISGATLRVGHC